MCNSCNSDRNQIKSRDQQIRGNSGRIEGLLASKKRTAAGLDSQIASIRRQIESLRASKKRNAASYDSQVLSIRKANESLRTGNEYSRSAIRRRHAR